MSSLNRRGAPVAALLLALGGCASHSPIVSTGPDHHFLSRQAATGFQGIAALKAEALADAGAFCAKRFRRILVTNIVETQPPYVWGNFPRVDLHFRCLQEDDPDLTRQRLEIKPGG